MAINDDTADMLSNQYFEWLYQRVFSDRRPKQPSYRKLLMMLHATDFAYSIPMDGNRAEEGIGLRYRFGSECSYDDRIIDQFLNIRPCSVLEMMVALSINCEEHIMGDPDIGDRTGRWFILMVKSLGLEHMEDGRFDYSSFSAIMDKFLTRNYRRNGQGGLFTIRNSNQDLRKVEIWYQMCWYLDQIA